MVGFIIGLDAAVVERVNINAKMLLILRWCIVGACERMVNATNVRTLCSSKDGPMTPNSGLYLGRFILSSCDVRGVTLL